MLEAGLILGTALLAFMTVLPLSRSPKWWVRGLDFPRMQLAVLLSVLLVAQFALGWYADWHLILVATSSLCLGYQLWWILPYTPFFPKETSPARAQGEGPRISIMAANVLTPNRRADRLLGFVREHSPDVLILVETDDWWDASLRQLDQEYPYRLRQPQDNLYGMHLFSRLALEDPEISFLVEDDVPSMHARLRVTPELSVRMHFLHPAPPSPSENDESTERDVELLVVARSVQRDDEPTVVAGDLNDVAWSRTTRLFRKGSRLLDPRVGRGMFSTFHAQYPFLRWPLDHFFHSDHFRLVRMLRLPAFGSDHFPIMIELQFDPLHQSAQRGLEADATDHQHIDAKLAEDPAEPADVPRPAKG